MPVYGGRGVPRAKSQARTPGWEHGWTASAAVWPPPAGWLRPVWAGVLLACCVILVAVLGMLFAHQTTANRLDRAVDAPIITWLGGHQGLADGWPIRATRFRPWC